MRDKFGRIDDLFNNTGLNDSADGSIFDVSQETWHRVIAANLDTVYLCCKHAIPHLLPTILRPAR